MPETYEGLLRIQSSIGTAEEEAVLEKEFAEFKSVSIDYGVMEKAKNIYILSGSFGWDDVGSWSALYDISNKDGNMNVVKGDVIALDTTSSYIRGGKRTIATIGLDNIVVVDSDDSLLIAAKGKIQDVKKVAELIKARNN